MPKITCEEIYQADQTIRRVHKIYIEEAHKKLRKLLGIKHNPLWYRSAYQVSETSARIVKALAGPHGETVLRMLEIKQGEK